MANGRYDVPNKMKEIMTKDWALYKEKVETVSMENGEKPVNDDSDETVIIVSNS